MRGKSILAAAVALAFFLGSAGIAQAAPDPGLPTITTFTLISGPLTIVPLTAAVLTNSAPISSSTGGTAVSGSLGLVTVLDLRGTSAPWVASAASTTFTGGLPTSSTSTSVVYNAGTITKVLGTPSIPASVDTTLTTTPAPVVSPTSIAGANSVTWLPTLTVNLPTTALAGLYTGTVTTSVA